MRARVASERVTRILAKLPDEKLWPLAYKGFEPAIDALLGRYERLDPGLFAQVVCEVRMGMENEGRNRKDN